VSMTPLEAAVARGSREDIFAALSRRVRRAGPRPRGSASWKRWIESGRFVYRAAPWTIWATLTFRFAVTSDRLATSSVFEWLDQIAHDVGQRLRAAYTVEPFATGERHVHALVSCPAGARLTTARAAAHWWRGHVQVRAYQPSRGAAWYLVKFPDAWDLTWGRPSKHWPRQPSP
jgi:hypothetical protein